MKKYFRLFRAKYNYWFGENAIPVWILPILIPIGLILVLLSGLEAALCVIGAVIILPIDGILNLFNKALVWVIEKVFMRGEK